MASTAQGGCTETRRSPALLGAERVLGAGERLVLPSIGCEIAVDRIYLKVFKKPAS